MLTIKDLESHIKKVEYSYMWKKTVICLLTLDNGFEVVWSAACVKTKDYDERRWENISYENAVDKLWELYWFLEHCKRNPEDIPTLEHWG